MGGILLGIVAATLNALWPRGVTGFGGTVFGGTVDELLPGVPKKVVEAKAWLMKLDAVTAERNGGQEGAVLALYQKCPHLGCTVPWRADYSYEDPRIGQKYSGWFLCPCHGSTYSGAGVRVFGPAPRSMDTFALSIENGNITINTGDITPGSVDNASRAVLPG
jgi:cytochrome b6-f complex iron-sulfur subunit